MKRFCDVLMFLWLGGSLGALGHSAIHWQFWAVMVPVCIFTAVKDCVE